MRDKGRSIATMIILCMLLTGCSLFIDKVPDEVTIEGEKYVTGFYEKQYSRHLDTTTDRIYEDGMLPDKVYTVDNREYKKINFSYDCFYCDGGNNFEPETFYCREEQFEQLSKYYADDNNYDYYCRVGWNMVGSPPDEYLIEDLDYEKYQALMTFGEEHDYQPFSPKKRKDLLSFPALSPDANPQLVFYRNSKDGYFSSFKGYEFYVIEDELYLLYYRDEKKEEWKMFKVPSDLSTYFMNLMSGN